MPDKVKAAVMTAPGKIEVQMLPYPKLERGALILKMEMSGICGTDKHAYQGQTLLYGGTEAEQHIVFPAVHGHENIGEIVEIDPRDRFTIEYHGNELKVGDRVTMCPNVICGHCYYCRHIFAYPFCAKNTTIGLSYPSDRPPYVVGGWAEYMFVPPKAWVYKVPDDFPTKLGALVELFVVTATLDRAKEFSRLEARGFGFGDTVVVQGVGPIGLLHVTKARILGAGKIIAVDTSQYKLNLAMEFGADYAINMSETTKEERVARVRELTDGRGADVVVECAGVADALPEGLEMMRRGGTYIETGNFVDTGETTINVHRHLAAKNALVIGNCNHPHSGYYRAMEMMLRYNDRFPFEKLVTHVFKIDDAAEAMEKSLDPESLKVAIVP
ncbi:MAG TPA: zinc-binding dehydrogenase [Firmicutes bacterium]|nr:zinc-binding dehydrogenase [Bacillota bacterium]